MYLLNELFYLSDLTNTHLFGMEIIKNHKTVKLNTNSINYNDFSGNANAIKIEIFAIYGT